LSAQINLSNGAPSATENFDGLGSSATAALPSDWKMSVAGASSPTWAAAGNFTAVNNQASAASPTTGGRYNWGTAAGTDRSIGFMTSGSYASPNSIMVFFSNSGTTNISALSVSYAGERYRINSTAADISFFYSLDGSSWTAVSAGDIAASNFPTATSSYIFSSPTIVNRSAIPITGLSITPGSSFYLRWNITTGGSNSQGIGIDDFSITATFSAACTPPADPTGIISGTTPACSSTSLSFSNPNANYYWQTSATGTSTTNSTISNLPVSTSGSYYVRAYNGTCWSTNSIGPYTVTVNSAPSINTQPSSPAAVCGSFSGMLTMAVTATSPSYQWQYSADGSTNWQSVTDGVPNGGVTYTNATGAALTITGLTQTYYFRGSVTTAGCATVYTNSATVTVNGTPSTPVAIAGSSIGSNSFTANWNSVPGATGYYVDVYQNIISSNNITEEFNGGTSAPTSWTFTGISGTYTTTTNFGNSSPSIRFDNSNDRVVTASVPSSATSLSFWLKGQGTNSTSAFLVEGFNGSAWVTIENITNSIPTSGTTKTYNSSSTPALPANLTQFRFTYTQSVGNLAFDDVTISYPITTQTYVTGYQNVLTTDNFLEVTGLSSSTQYYYVVRSTNGSCTSSNSNIITVTTDAPCTPTATVTSFNPATGPVGTLVTITGTGFTGATAVKFGSVASTNFTVVSSTSIIAEVPSNTPTGSISVTVAGCDATSASNFTLLSQSSCGISTGYSSDVFISEVYDAESGSLSYIEIFNGTNATKNLSGYFVRIRTGTSTDNDYALSGNLASGATMILLVGSSSASCTIPVTTIPYPSGSGFNGNDRIYLYNGSTMIDYVPNPNYGGATAAGFSQARRSTSIGPSTTYNSADWTISTTESCSNLGIAPYTIGGTTITVNVQPADVNCNSTLTFSTSVTSSVSNPTYVWHFNDPSTMSTWGLVSEISGSPYNYPVTVSGVGTSSITITGNTAVLQDFQFYVEVKGGTSPQCIVSTNAAQYKFDTRPYYRTKSNGAWNATSTWEMSSDNSTWVSVCNYPVARTSSSVQIDHNITLGLDVDIDKITISTSGILDISSTGKLTVYDSTAASADLILNGTLIDGGSTSNGLDFGTGASWTMSSSATIIKTNISSATAYRDNYYTGISNIPSTANWIIRKSGSTDVSFTTTAGTSGSYPSSSYYPNLTFENSSGVAYSFTNKFTGSTDYARVKGNLDIGGSTYTTGVTVINENTNSNPLLVSGNITVRTGSTLTNAGTNSGTGFETKGNLTVEGTLTINNNNTGLLKFSGTNTQTVSGTGTMNIQDLTIGNSLIGSGVLVNKSFGVYGVMTFGSASKLTFGTGDISIKSTATNTARVAAIPTDASINYTAAGRFYVERYISRTRKWQLLAVPTNTSQKINEAWQEGAADINQNPVPGFGMQITDNNSNWQSQGFDAYSPGGPSVKTFSPQVGATPDSWNGINSTNTNIKTDGGYMSYVRGDRLSLSTNGVSNPTVLRTKGQLYRDDISVSVNPNKFAVVGNPYASAVDIRLLTKNNLTNEIYIWDPYLGGNYNLGGYRTFTWNGVNYVPTPSGGTGPYSGASYNYINSGIAFFVKSNGVSSSSITFTENSKASTSDLVTRTYNEPAQTLRINLHNTSTGSPELVDGSLSIFSNEFSDGVDWQDGEKLVNTGLNMGLMRDGKLLVVERRSRIKGSDTLFLNMTGLRVGSYSWEINPSQLSHPNRKAYLLDRFNQSKRELSLDNNNEIAFTIENVPASYASDRFMIIFQLWKNNTHSPSLPKTDNVITTTSSSDDNGSIRVYPNPVSGQLIRAQLMGIEAGEYIAEVRTITGQPMHSEKIIIFKGMQTADLRLASRVPAGEYLLQFKGMDKTYPAKLIITK